MKPCSHFKENLVWLALGNLEAEKSRQIRAHLQACPGCHGYFEEMSDLSKRLESQPNQSSIQASEAFHQNLMLRISSQSKHPFWAATAGIVESLIPNWRFLVPASAAALILCALAGSLRHPVASRAVRSTPLVNSESEFAARSGLTLANYLVVANRSLESLDALLTKQGEQRNHSSGPVYTASTIPDWKSQN